MPGAGNHPLRWDAFLLDALDMAHSGAGAFVPLLLWNRGKKELILLGAVLFLVACGMGRMALSDEAWSRQSSWAVGSSGRWTGIVRESPTVNREGEPYARYAVELETLRYDDGEEKDHLRHRLHL